MYSPFKSSTSLPIQPVLDAVPNFYLGYQYNSAQIE